MVFSQHRVPVSDRITLVYVEHGSLEREGHALVLRRRESDIIIPVGVTAVVGIGPGVSVSHAAVALCAQEGALLIWMGEHGVRLYAAGNPRGASDRLVHQCLMHANPQSRLAVARRIYHTMFGEPAPCNRSIEQLRGIEGAKVKTLYITQAEAAGVAWDGRDRKSLDRPIDAALAGVNAALYGLCEAVILALGYSPSIGFIHSGDQRSFVFDVSDMLKFKTVVPLAFQLACEHTSGNMEHRSRTACRDLFFREKMADQLISAIEDALHGDDSSGS